MNRIAVTAVIAVSQLALVGVGVAPQLSARLTGDTYLMTVAPLDPIDPFRGAYVALDYPDLRHDSQSSGEPGLGALDDDQEGDNCDDCDDCDASRVTSPPRTEP